MSDWPTKEAVFDFLDRLDPGSCVLVLPFNSQTFNGLWAHPGDPGLRQAITELELQGGTRLYDALTLGYGLMRDRRASAGRAPPKQTTRSAGLSLGELMRFRSAPGVTGWIDTAPPSGHCAIPSNPWMPTQTRYAVAVVTDGRDTVSETTADDVVLAAWGSNIPLFVLRINRRLRARDVLADSKRRIRFDPPGLPNYSYQIEALERISEFSGGATLQVAGQSGEVQEGFNKLGSALSSYYVLGFAPSLEHDGTSFVDRRDIEVMVPGSDYEVLVQPRMLRGQGAAEGGALDSALRGFHELASGQAETAARSFDAALTLAPDLGIALYGRGIALAQLGRDRAAAEALQEAANRAPWLPDVRARQAELSLRMGEFDHAWEHALEAYADGSHVTPLLEQLQSVSPRDVDLAKLTERTAVAIEVIGERGVLAASALPGIVAQIATQLRRVRTLNMASDADNAEFLLRLQVDSIEEEAESVSVSGSLRLVAVHKDREIGKAEFFLKDIASTAALERVLADALQKLLPAITDARISGTTWPKPTRAAAWGW